MMQRLLLSFVLGLALCLTPMAVPKAIAQSHLVEYPLFYSKFSPKYVPLKKAYGGRLSGMFKEVKRHGLVLWVAKPRRNLPTVMYFHGSTGGLEKRSWKYHWLADTGFGVIAVSYPGSSGSDGRASTRSILQSAHKTYRDIRKLVGNSKVILMGESFGTGVAIRLAYELERIGTPPAGVALQAPYSSGYALVRHQAPRIAGVLKGRADPWPNDRYIRALSVPVFIMHGGRDRRVPISQGKQLYSLSPSPHKLLVTRAHAGHSNIWSTDNVKWLMARWMKERAQ